MGETVAGGLVEANENILYGRHITADFPVRTSSSTSSPLVRGPRVKTQFPQLPCLRARIVLNKFKFKHPTHLFVSVERRYRTNTVVGSVECAWDEVT